MNKQSKGSYVKQFKEKIELKDNKAKSPNNKMMKGINFDNLKDWDHIVNESENNPYSIHKNSNFINNANTHTKELRAEDIYNPQFKQEYLKANLMKEDEDEGELEVIPSTGKKANDNLNGNNNNQNEGFNNDYSVNTSVFTYKQNDYDKIDLSTANYDDNNKNNNNNNMIIGKKIPLAFCDNMVSQIKKSSSPEHYAISPVVIKEEDEDDDDYNKNSLDNKTKNEKDSLDNGNKSYSDKLTNNINNDDSNDITHQQMKELDEEMNKLITDMKVKAYEEKRGENKLINKEKKTLFHQQPQKKKNNLKKGKSDENKMIVQNVKEAISSMPISQETGKFGGGNANNTIIKNNRTDNNSIENFSIQNQYQNYSIPSIQQCQQMGLNPQMYRNYNPYQTPLLPVQQSIMQNNNNTPYSQFQIPINMNITPIQVQQHGNVHIYNNQNIKYQPPQTIIQNISSINDNIMTPRSENSKAKVMSQYRPKTMKEYKEKYNDSNANKKLGGLGANIGTKEWEEKQEKINKIKQYSSQVKATNKEKQVINNVQIKNSHLNNNNNKKHRKDKQNSRIQQETDLKNKLIHDSLSNEEENELNVLENKINNNSNNSDKQITSNNIIISSSIRCESPLIQEANIINIKRGGHVNFIKNLKQMQLQHQSQNQSQHIDHNQENNINLANFKQVSIANQISPKNKNKIYTTMKQPTIQPEQRRNKNLEPTKRQINVRPKSSIGSKAKCSNYLSIDQEDDLTLKFMAMPCTNLIDNLLLNHQSYNNQVNKIKKYLDNK